MRGWGVGEDIAIILFVLFVGAVVACIFGIQT